MLQAIGHCDICGENGVMNINTDEDYICDDCLNSGKTIKDKDEEAIKKSIAAYSSLHGMGELQD